MRYFVAHLDDAPSRPWQESDPAEEIYVIPYGTRVATAVPIGALRHVLPSLSLDAADVPPGACTHCRRTLPAPTAADEASG